MLDLKGYGWMLWDGVQITLAVAACAMALALGLGLLGAWGKLSQSKYLALNSAIVQIRSDGTYKTINAKYFDFDVYGD